MGHLRLINLYNYPLKLQFNFDVFYHTPKADELYKHQDDYSYDGSPAYRISKHMNRAFEDAQRLSVKLEEAKDLLKKQNINDYSVIQPGDNKLEFYFKSNQDRVTGAAVLAPYKVIEVPFIKAKEGTSHQRLEEIRAFLQSRYDQVDLESAQLTARIKLRADFTKHAIHAQARAIDIPRILYQAGLFQTALINA